MARIPIYEERQAVNQNMPVSEMRAPDMNAGAIGKALGQVGAAFKDVANVMSSIEDEKAKTWAAETASQARVDWQARMQRLQESADPGAPGFTQQVAREFDAWSEETMKSAPNRVSQSYLGQSLLSLNDSVKTSAIQFEAIEGRANRVRQLKQSYQNDAIFLANSNDPEAIARLRGDSDAVLDSAKITPAQREELRQNRDALWGRTGVEKLIEENPQSLLDQRAAAKKAGLRTSGNAFLDLLPPDQWDTYTKAAEVKIKQQRAEYRAELQNQLRDRAAMALDGISDTQPLSRAQFERAYDTQQEANDAYASYQRMQKLAGTIGNFHSQSGPEIAAAVEALKPVPGKGYADQDAAYEAAKKAASVVGQKRDQDPAQAAMLSSSSVRKAQEELDRARTSPNPNAQEIAAATEKLATVSLAEQQRLGIRAPKLLTKQMEASIVARMNSSDQNAKQVIEELQYTYKDKFGMVMDQLIATKQVPPEHMVIWHATDESSKEAIANVNKVKLEDMKKTIDPATATSIKEKTISALDDVIGAFGNRTPAAQMHINSLNTTIQKLAIQIVQNSNASASDAVSQAYQMVLGKYEITDGIMYPKGMNFTDIKNGLETFVTDSVIPNLSVEDARNEVPGATDEDTQREYGRTVKARGVWVTNRDNTGAILYYRTTTGQYKPVLVNKKPVQVNFDDAAQLGQQTTFTPEGP